MSNDVFTLRSAAGLPTDPPALADATGVVIDAQAEYADGRLQLPDVAAATAQRQWSTTHHSQRWLTALQQW